MSRLREGDDLALNDIMDRWQSRLTGYLIRLTGSEAVAVDLAQETFVRVYGNRFRYRPSGAFSTWLFAIASNLTSAGSCVTQQFPWMRRRIPQAPSWRAFKRRILIRARGWNRLNGPRPFAMRLPN